MSARYEPMDQVRKNFRISWYRCPIERDVLKKLTKRSNTRGLFQALGHIALQLVTGYFTWRFFYQGLWWAFALTLFAHGTMVTFWGMAAIHELGHKTVFKSKWLNILFLWIYSLFGWFNFYWYNISHTYHHLYTLHPRGDREVTLPKKPSLNFFYLLQLFTFNLFGGFESAGLIPTVGGTFRVAFTGKFGVFLGMSDDNWVEAIFTPDQDGERKKAVYWARFLIVFHLGVIAVSIVFGLWPLAILVTFGPFIGNWLRYFVGVPMHTGLRDNVADFRKCVRTIKLDPFSSFLYWRMNYHAEHHMYAAVPCYNLRKLHKTVKADMPEPKSLAGAWKEMRATWKKQQEDPAYQFDTPVPGDGNRGPADQDPLEASLGDLEPDSLR